MKDWRSEMKTCGETAATPSFGSVKKRFAVGALSVLKRCWLDDLAF